MKGAGFCPLNNEVHYIVWLINRVLGTSKTQKEIHQTTMYY